MLPVACRAFGQGNPAIATQYAMPGKLWVVVAAEHACHQTRTARQAGAPGNFPITGDLARGNCADYLDNPQPRLLAGQ